MKHLVRGPTRAQLALGSLAIWAVFEIGLALLVAWFARAGTTRLPAVEALLLAAPISLALAGVLLAVLAFARWILRRTVRELLLHGTAAEARVEAPEPERRPARVDELWVVLSFDDAAGVRHRARSRVQARHAEALSAGTLPVLFSPAATPIQAVAIVSSEAVAVWGIEREPPAPRRGASDRC